MIRGLEHLRNVAAYTPGASVEQISREYGLTHVEKLASNENPLGSAPSAQAAVLGAMQTAQVYGDGGAALRQRLAQHHDVSEQSIVVGNGSDALIHQVMRTFVQPSDHVVSSQGAFVSFSIAARTVGAEPHLVPLTADYRFDVQALAAACGPETKVLYIANPNNPTGTFIPRDELTWLLDQVASTTLVILDEAYVQYAAALAPDAYPDGLTMLRPNVMVLRTFSKAYGLAAYRIGYAVGSPEVMAWMQKTKLPFDPNALGCAAAIAALDDHVFVEDTVQLNARGLELLQGTLVEHGYVTSTSIANFVMVDCGSAEAATDFHRSLLERGFITRPLAGFGLPTCVRISTGTDDQNHRLAHTLGELSQQIASRIV